MAHLIVLYARIQKLFLTFFPSSCFTLHHNHDDDDDDEGFFGCFILSPLTQRLLKLYMIMCILYPHTYIPFYKYFI